MIYSREYRLLLKRKIERNTSSKERLKNIKKLKKRRKKSKLRNKFKKIKKSIEEKKLIESKNRRDYSKKNRGLKKILIL